MRPPPLDVQITCTYRVFTDLKSFICNSSLPSWQSLVSQERVRRTEGHCLSAIATSFAARRESGVRFSVDPTAHIFGGLNSSLGFLTLGRMPIRLTCDLHGPVHNVLCAAVDHKLCPALLAISEASTSQEPRHGICSAQKEETGRRKIMIQTSFLQVFRAAPD